ESLIDAVYTAGRGWRQTRQLGSHIVGFSQALLLMADDLAGLDLDRETIRERMIAARDADIAGRAAQGERLTEYEQKIAERLSKQGELEGAESVLRTLGDASELARILDHEIRGDVAAADSASYWAYASRGGSRGTLEPYVETRLAAAQERLTAAGIHRGDAPVIDAPFVLQGSRDEMMATLRQRRYETIAAIGSDNSAQTNAALIALLDSDVDYQTLMTHLSVFDQLEIFELIADVAQSGEGAVFDELEHYLLSKAAPIEAVLNDLVPASEIAGMKAELRVALARLGEGPEHEPARIAIQDRLALLESYESLSELAPLINPRNFQHGDLQDWLAREGPILLGGLALSVGAGMATASVVGSPAAPAIAAVAARLLVMAATTTASFQASTELLDIALNHDKAVGSDMTVWRRVLRGEMTEEQARIASWRNFRRGFAMSAATLGAARFVGAGVRAGGSRVFAARARTRGENLARMVEEYQKQLVKGGSDAATSNFSRYMQELGQEFAQESVQMAVQSWAANAAAANSDTWLSVEAGWAFMAAVAVEALPNSRVDIRMARQRAFERLSLPAPGYYGRTFFVAPQGVSGKDPLEVFAQEYVGDDSDLVAENHGDFVLVRSRAHPEHPPIVLVREGADLAPEAVRIAEQNFMVQHIRDVTGDRLLPIDTAGGPRVFQLDDPDSLVEFEQHLERQGYVVERIDDGAIKVHAPGGHVPPIIVVTPNRVALAHENELGFVDLERLDEVAQAHASLRALLGDRVFEQIVFEDAEKHQELVEIVNQARA
ncbi:MAG: hypothetical protein AAF658_09150, partial [Myxococcota bacterium]